jgi:uncharacterized protein YecE (DUF72 family)
MVVRSHRYLSGRDARSPREAGPSLCRRRRTAGVRSSTPPVAASTSPLAVVRFHGPNAETYEKPNISAAERFRYLYSEEELKGWVAPIRGLAEQADRVHMLMNNCYGDYGVRNARQLAELLAR